ncbi:hypothetical protein SF83666_a43720 (plasmid) [Sinorhizobium fredii CCBAU 83666]|nr:hypothetical protein SF83666_a43720 [Sinorhizobium fredii CCBAU 83666]
MFTPLISEPSGDYCVSVLQGGNKFKSLRRIAKSALFVQIVAVSTVRVP